MAFSTRATERGLLALQQAGELEPDLSVEIAAKGFASMQSGVLLWWIENPSRATRDELVDTLTRLHPALAARVR